jgi:hypothetical protein
MAEMAQTSSQRAPGESRATLTELAELPTGSSQLSAPLPDWVTQAHLRWLETGEGDPWGGYFS